MEVRIPGSNQRCYIRKSIILLLESGEKGICELVTSTLIQLGMSMKRQPKATSTNRKIVISLTMISKEE